MDQKKTQFFKDWVLDEQEQFNQFSVEEAIHLEAKIDSEKASLIPRRSQRIKNISTQKAFQAFVDSVKAQCNLEGK